MLYGLPLDLERPTAMQMLPTLLDQGPWRCVAYGDGLAVIALRSVDDDTLHQACALHAALDRGLLVLV